MHSSLLALAGGAALAATLAFPIAAVGVTPSQLSSSEGNDLPDVEYFNEENFDSGYGVSIVQQTDGIYSASLSCPPPVNPAFPPASLEVTMWDRALGQSTDCWSKSPITLSSQQTDPDCTSSGCTMMVVVSDRLTADTLSTTAVNLPLRSAPLEPLNLSPATVPIGKASPVPAASGTISIGKEAQLTLCSNSQACTQPTPVVDGSPQLLVGRH